MLSGRPWKDSGLSFACGSCVESRPRTFAVDDGLKRGRYAASITMPDPRYRLELSDADGHGALPSGDGDTRSQAIAALAATLSGGDVRVDRIFSDGAEWDSRLLQLVAHDGVSRFE